MRAIEIAEERGAGESRSGRSTASAAELSGTRVEGDEIPLAIDELPLIALAACFAEGETVIAGAGELRRKESDRIETVTEALAGLGAGIEATPDGMVIAGGGGIDGGTVDSHGDHRIAMLGAIAGLASRRGVEVDGIEAAAVSYPGFAADLEVAAAIGSARMPDPGPGESSSSSLESARARTSWRSLGSKAASSPGPPETLSPPGREARSLPRRPAARRARGPGARPSPRLRAARSRLPCPRRRR